MDAGRRNEEAALSRRNQAQAQPAAPTPTSYDVAAACSVLPPLQDNLAEEIAESSRSDLFTLDYLSALGRVTRVYSALSSRP